MFIDARSIERDKSIHTDVCIIGAGAAGITLARELKDSSFRVNLLESGGLDYDSQVQGLNKGQSIGHSYHVIGSARIRIFGGATAHWNGFCRPLDAIDFRAR